MYADRYQRGVIICKNLNFSMHCNNIVAKAYSRIYLILKSFISRDRVFLVNMFKIYVRPLLESGTCVWSPHALKDIDRIESVQRYFTRCIPGLATLTYSDRLRLLNLDSLEVRRLRADCVMLFKLHAGLVKINFNDFCVRRSRVLIV
jgi:hypothetical protein